jgi:hypothetical protein
MVFCFKPAYWEELNALQNRLNISTGDLMRLFICAYLFPSGKTALRLKDLAAVFTERKAWQYNILLTHPVKEMLAQRARDECNRESEVVAKAIAMYLTRNVTDKSLLIAKMSEIVRVVQNLQQF